MPSVPVAAFNVVVWLENKMSERPRNPLLYASYLVLGSPALLVMVMVEFASKFMDRCGSVKSIQDNR